MRARTRSEKVLFRKDTVSGKRSSSFSAALPVKRESSRTCQLRFRQLEFAGVHQICQFFHASGQDEVVPQLGIVLSDNLGIHDSDRRDSQTQNNFHAILGNFMEGEGSLLAGERHAFQSSLVALQREAFINKNGLAQFSRQISCTRGISFSR